MQLHVLVSRNIHISGPMIQCKKYEVLNYEEFSGGHISHHAAKKVYYDCSKLWDFSTAEMAENAQTDKTDSQHLKVSYWEATL